MLALGIHYLNGWAMAAEDGANKGHAEWPTHPDRVFMAMAAAWFESGEPGNEGQALAWLEGLGAPRIAASDATLRTTSMGRGLPVSYVPVNDTRASKKPPSTGDLDALKDAGLRLLPEHRLRQARTFPVAIPRDPNVYLIWPDADPAPHGEALLSLAAKVTNIGHSASLVQMWLETNPPPATLVPADASAERRLRVFAPGRLDDLERRCNRAAWLDYHDRAAAIIAAGRKDTRLQPKRVAWKDFPNALLLATESQVKQHPRYAAAKAGDAVAASLLVRSLAGDDVVEGARRFLDAIETRQPPIVASAHAYERNGVNAIPAALAELLGERLGLMFDDAIVQLNIVGHTGADGYSRLARQAAFEGPVRRRHDYVLVDDFVGQGGTLANLRGHIESGGGHVIAAIVLTGKPYSSTLALKPDQLDELRRTHGKCLEKWWRAEFGHAFDRLTQSEARYLARSPDADAIRDRIAAAKQGGSGEGHPGDPGNRPTLNDLKAEQTARHPNGRPVSRRPEPQRWQGYASLDRAPPREPPQPGLFDPRLLVLAVSGKRLPLTSTLKLTRALRGALLAACPEPIPEWISGHDTAGRASKEAHVALLPLPFVGGEHGDGRVTGMALALPRGIPRQTISEALNRLLRDINGLPREIRLFDGRWLETSLEAETRESRPWNLRPETWTAADQGACLWASVTPVVLDRHFKGKERWRKAADSLKDACERLGQSRPETVELHPVTKVRGAPRADLFPSLHRKHDGGRMVQVHALIQFPRPVIGPVLLGAGRFRGYGLFRPLNRCSRGATRMNRHG